MTKKTLFLILVIATLAIDFCPSFIIFCYEWNVSNIAFMNKALDISTLICLLALIPTHLIITVISLKWIYVNKEHIKTKLLYSIGFILLMIIYLMFILTITIAPQMNV